MPLAPYHFMNQGRLPLLYLPAFRGQLACQNEYIGMIVLCKYLFVHLRYSHFYGSHTGVLKYYVDLPSRTRKTNGDEMVLASGLTDMRGFSLTRHDIKCSTAAHAGTRPRMPEGTRRLVPVPRSKRYFRPGYMEARSSLATGWITMYPYARPGLRSCCYKDLVDASRGSFSQALRNSDMPGLITFISSLPSAASQLQCWSV